MRTPSGVVLSRRSGGISPADEKSSREKGGFLGCEGTVPPFPPCSTNPGPWTSTGRTRWRGPRPCCSCGGSCPLAMGAAGTRQSVHRNRQTRLKCLRKRAPQGAESIIATSRSCKISSQPPFACKSWLNPSRRAPHRDARSGNPNPATDTNQALLEPGNAHQSLASHFLMRARVLFRKPHHLLTSLFLGNPGHRSGPLCDHGMRWRMEDGG